MTPKALPITAITSKPGGSEEDIAEMRRLFTMMKTNFSDKGYPVIIGEYEVIHWKNGSLKDGTMDFLGTQSCPFQKNWASVPCSGTATAGITVPDSGGILTDFRPFTPGNNS